MTYTELIKKVAAENEGLSQKRTREIVDSMISVMGSALCDGEEVSLFKFGKFRSVNIPAREFKSFGSDKPTKMEAHNVVRFKPAATLKEAVR